MIRRPDSIPDTPRRAVDRPALRPRRELPSPAPTSPLGALRKHLRLFLLVFGVCFVAFAAITFWLPRQYQAEMKLLVRNDRQDAIVSPQANASVLRSSEVSETQVNSELELIRSADVLRTVATKLQLYKNEHGAESSGDAAEFNSRLNAAVDKLNKQLTVSVVKKTNVIDILYVSRDPQQCAAVLRTLSEVYLQKHLTVHGTSGLSTFFDDQAVKFQSQLAAAEADLRQLRQGSKTLVTPEEKENLMQQALEAEASLEAVNAEISDRTQQLAKTQQSLQAMQARVVTTERTAANQQLEGALVQTLTELQNRRTQMVMKFRPDDRVVTELDEEIARTSAALNNARKSQAVEQATDLNPIRQNAEREAVAQQTALAGLTAKQKVLRQTVDQYRQRLFDIAAMSERNDTLSREIKEYEDNYMLYSKKGEEARIADALDRQRVANISLVQAPSVPQKPSSPNRTVDLALGFICSAFLAGVVVMIAELGGKSTGTHPSMMSERWLATVERERLQAAALD